MIGLRGGKWQKERQKERQEKKQKERQAGTATAA